MLFVLLGFFCPLDICYIFFNNRIMQTTMYKKFKEIKILFDAFLCSLLTVRMTSLTIYLVIQLHEGLGMDRTVSMAE